MVPYKSDGEQTVIMLPPATGLTSNYTNKIGSDRLSGTVV